MLYICYRQNCDLRCASEPGLCTASTSPDLELTDTNLADNIGSSDPGQNPAFHDFTKVFVPYCSSDVYAGTRDASSASGGRVFRGGWWLVTSASKSSIRRFVITEKAPTRELGPSPG